MKRAIRALVPIAAVLALASCQQLFTSSLGVWAARDLSLPADLSAADTLELSAEAVANGDTELAAALLPALEANLDAATPGSAAYDELSAAAAETVVIATGISEAVTTIVTLIPFEELMAAGGSAIALEPGVIAAIDEAIASISVGAAATAILDALVLDPGAATADQLVLAALAVAVELNPGLSVAGLIDGSETLPDLTGTLVEDLLGTALTQASAYPGDSGLYDMFGPYLGVTP